VKLESFAAGAKPKVIKEVKAIVPNLTLIEVRPVILFFFSFFAEYSCRV
jgi:large subunit ribosomal protein L7/L12